MASFAPFEFHSNITGWGPPPDFELERFKFGVNWVIENSDTVNEEKYSALSADQRPADNWLGKGIGRQGLRVCDFTLAGQKWQEQRAAKGKGKGKNIQGLAPAGKDAEGFELVDNKPLLQRSQGKGRASGKSKGKGRGIAINYQEGILGAKQPKYYSANQSQGKGKNKKGKGKGGQSGPSFKEWSVPTKTEWSVKREIQLSSLTKLQVNAKDVKTSDIVWCGRLNTYNKEYDRIATRMEKPVQRFEDLNFFNVTTSDDPILQGIITGESEHEGCEDITVIATDQVLACLIAASRSVYSWDVVATKVGGKLLFDKRDGSIIDFLTVNETARDPPNADSQDHMNSPLKLGQEASCINQNFSQMVLDTDIPVERMSHENPFEEDGDASAASGAYRYRRITLPGNPKEESEFNQNPVHIAVRTEVNCKMSTDDQLVFVKALNEFDPKPTYSWRTALDAQRGAVLATELKNNSFKLGRWTAQSILSGCDLMKVGYVSRASVKDPWNHVVLGVQTYQTDVFAEQMGMSRNNAFGILRTMIDVIMAYGDGKYLIMKDPTKAILRIYEIPWDTFAEDEGGEDDDDEEEMRDLDEEGNEVPQSASMPLTRK